MASPVVDGPFISATGRAWQPKSAQELTAAFPVEWLPDSQELTLQKPALPSRCPRAVGLREAGSLCGLQLLLPPILDSLPPRQTTLSGEAGRQPFRTGSGRVLEKAPAGV